MMPPTIKAQFRAVLLSNILTAVLLATAATSVVSAAHAANRNNCVDLFAVERSREDWSPFLNPQSISTAGQFKFMIHAVLSSRRTEGMRELVKEQLGDAYRESDFIDLNREPYRIAEKTLLSTSIITESMTQSWQRYGFILRVPYENLIAGAHVDLGTKNWAQGDELAEHLKELKARFPLGKPEDLLGHSQWFNEVVVYGTHPKTGNKVEPVALFVKVKRNGEPILRPDEQIDFDRLKALFKGPIVKIVDP